MQLFSGSDPFLIDLTEKLVRYAPERRLTAAEALAHPYFDDLRDERSFKKLGKYKNFEHFFNF